MGSLLPQLCSNPLPSQVEKPWSKRRRALAKLSAWSVGHLPSPGPEEEGHWRPLHLYPLQAVKGGQKKVQHRNRFPSWTRRWCCSLAGCCRKLTDCF